MIGANEFYGMVHSANEKYFYKPDNHKPMKLQTTITQTKEIEITLPVFFKEKQVCDNYLAVLDEKTAIDLYVNNSGDYVSITHTTPEKRNLEIQRAINEKWDRISEVDFLQAYDDALSAISLRPKLNEQNFVDDLETIGLKTNKKGYQPINFNDTGAIR